MCLKSSCRCGHCKALAPHYEEAATALKEKNIKLAKVNCVDEADFCQSNGIQGYPCVSLISWRLTKLIRPALQHSPCLPQWCIQ